MAGFRISLVLLAALVFAPAGRSQSQVPLTPPAQGAINKIYSLADLGDDPNLCKWIAETIPQMIKPGCWSQQNLCLYAPAKVLAIHQTPEVHAQVEEFLANLRKTASRTKHDSQVTRAQYVPDVVRPVGPTSASQAYPVPAALPTPKHLFHFIIRYEGAGIIDSNVTKFTEALTKASGMGDNQARWEGPSSSMPSTMPVPPAPNVLVPTTHGASVIMLPTVSTQGTRMMPPADPLPDLPTAEPKWTPPLEPVPPARPTSSLR